MESKELNQIPQDETIRQEENPVNEAKETPEVSENAAEVAEINETSSSEEVQPVLESVTAEAPVSIETEMAFIAEEDEEETELVVAEMIADETIEASSREELIEMLHSLVHAEGTEDIKGKVAQIKVAFRNKTAQERLQAAQAIANGDSDTELAPNHEDELEQRFNATFSIYREKRHQMMEELEKAKIENLNQKKVILEELKVLIESDELLKKTYDDFKALQEKWKQIGLVPKTEMQSLWQSYHYLVDKFFDKVRINKELKDLDFKKNLEAKIELCEKAEELLLEESMNEAFRQLQKLHEQWKEIGPVSYDKRDEIWDRFKGASDKINTRRRDYYEKLHGELQSNYEAKKALIEKAKEIVHGSSGSVKEWQSQTDQVNELFKLWKSVGPAPRKLNDEVWAEFKTLLDQFFQSKGAHFSTIKDQQLNNYNLKLDLCGQAEALQNSTEWKETSHELINLQKEWKKIGPVPRKHSDKIWRRFRAACDHFFNAKTAYFADIIGHEAENLNAKLALIKEVEEYPYTENKSENLAALKSFQRRWTEIGHVPIKDKNNVQNAFRKAVDVQMEKLGITSLDMSAGSFKSRFENVKEMPDGARTLSREMSQLQIRIQKMNEDISLWENNIGFLANSKNASILKEEFEKKIEKSRQEVKLMEAKVKFLRDEINKLK
jgi:hypothetical protein